MIDSTPIPISTGMGSIAETNADSLRKMVSEASNVDDAAARIDHAAQEFEGVFVSMLIKQMRETLQEGLFSKETSDSYGAIFDLYMGKHLAESSPLGVGVAVKAYLQGTENAKPETTDTRGDGAELSPPSDQ